MCLSEKLSLGNLWFYVLFGHNGKNRQLKSYHCSPSFPLLLSVLNIFSKLKNNVLDTPVN